jgi:Mycothiol maleylpyruvate isomerase N-terminal domain
VQGPSADAFSQASRYFVAAVCSVPASSWDETGLGTWSVLELVGHANRAHTTLEDYLSGPHDPEPPGSLYFSAEAIADRGRRAVAALGTDPPGAVAAASSHVIALVDATPADAQVASPVRTMSLAAYLPSRTAELTIHALDVLFAVGAASTAEGPVSSLPPVPTEALEEALRFVTGHAVRQGKGVVALLGLAGRSPLPPDFSVY